MCCYLSLGFSKILFLLLTQIESHVMSKLKSSSLILFKISLAFSTQVAMQYSRGELNELWSKFSSKSLLTTLYGMLRFLKIYCLTIEEDPRMTF